INYLSSSFEEDEPVVSPTVKCPFLGIQNDPMTYSANIDIPNYCHTSRSLVPVSIEYQISSCTSSNYQNCPVFSSSKRRPLPSKFINRDVTKNYTELVSWRSPWVWVIAFICICLVALVIGGYAFRSNLFGSSPLSTQPVVEKTGTRTLIVIMPPTDTPTSLPTRAHTSTPETEITQTQQAIFQMETVQADEAQKTGTASTLMIDQTQTEVAYASRCETDWENQLTVLVTDPVYSPIQSDLPPVITYGSIPFLVTWNVKNTSPDCSWTSIQFQTQLSNETRTFELMSADRIYPIINKEFSMKDQANRLVNQVDPGQTVSILIQVDGLELIGSFGEINKSFTLLVNGHLLPAGKLTAILNKWVIVKMPTKTPQPKPAPTKIAPTELPQPTPVPPQYTPTAGLP